MSIKKLFDAADKNRNYLSERTQKEAFQSVESKDNLAQLKKKQDTFVPQIDYADPANFAKFGSAYLYYDGAMTKITDYYPYDGSDAEINGFYNDLLDVEKYIFNNLYPRTNGYIKLSAEGWGDASSGTNYHSTGGYGTPASAEYITLKGGPSTDSAVTSLAKQSPDAYNDKFQYSNIYEDNLYTSAGLPGDYGKGTRQSNLQSNFDTGVTLEFWLKKEDWYITKTTKEVVFDAWTSGSFSGSADYGRITLELTGGVDGSPFLITAQSGSTGLFQQSIGATLTTASLSDWQHYAITLYNSGSNFISKLYVNGLLNDTNVETSVNISQLKQKDMMGRIGALMTAPSGTVDPGIGGVTGSAGVGVDPSELEGAGKLSGSLDEFRFWKEARSGQDIGRYWFTQVRGGANTDISNTTLGVYYKFNEGISTNSGIDAKVLDYAGRLTNGTWTGYGSTSRSTNSAIVESSASATEYKDPIIYATHPSVSALKSGLLSSGTFHDSTNNSAFISYAPTWVIENHENEGNDNLKIISHLAGTYFDKLYLYINDLPKLKQLTYTSASYKPVPFAQHLPQSLGLYTPELFIDASVMEKFLNRDENSLFESDLNDTKNMIYMNLYNNLTNIYKSKGTEKALRNVLRCFNVDESLIKINTYAKNTTFDLNNNYEQVLERKSLLNFNNPNNRNAVVYQASSSAVAQGTGYISGSWGLNYEVPYGLTVESQIVLPKFFTTYDNFDREYTDVSLFGMHTVNTGSKDPLENDTCGTGSNCDGTDTTYVSDDVSNFQVLAIKEAENSKNIYFKLTSSAATLTETVPDLTSSVFLNAYDNTEWNISVRVKAAKGALASQISGATSYDYDVVFEGENIDLGSVRRSFSVSGKMDQTTGNNFLGGAKRLYAGAQRTNITGAILNKSDVLMSSLRYWAKYLDTNALRQHAYDLDNYGIDNTYQNISPLDSNNGNLDILNLNMLALNWDFSSVTGSDSNGNFFVTDLSSGSLERRTNYGWLGNISGYRHPGYGYSFAASSTDVVDKALINAFKFIEPERATSADAIQILSEDDKVFGVTETVPSYVYTVEKSMYRAISEEMLDFFAGVIDFNNVIGEAVNRYRGRYKSLEKLREIFFRKVSRVSDVEKFIDYYKWFDDAIAEVIAQLTPASSGFTGDVCSTIESHVLERNKYKTQYPTLEAKQPNLDGAAHGYSGLHYPATDGSSPQTFSFRKGYNTRYRQKFWFSRALRTSEEITSGDATIDAQRETFRKIINSNPKLPSPSHTVSTPAGTTYSSNQYARRNFQKTQKLIVDHLNTRMLKGGVNFDPQKRIQFTYNSLYPFGPINTDNNVFVPENVLLGLEDDLVAVMDTPKDVALRKKLKRTVKVQRGRDYESGIGYYNVKSNLAFPFNIISSSVDSGYNKDIMTGFTASVEVTNLHNDVYGDDMEVPLQTTFTRYAVGGHQSRHVPLNTGSDDYTNRPEAWKMILGRCAYNEGAIGLVGADYPVEALGQEPVAATGTVTLSSNISTDDYVTIGDGDTSATFTAPSFNNAKSTLFADHAQSRIAIGGDFSSSYDNPELASPEFFDIETGTFSAWISGSLPMSGQGYIIGNGLPHASITFALRDDGANEQSELRLTQTWYDGDGGSTVAAYWETDNDDVILGQWNHVAVTFDATLTGSQQVTFFLNGAEVASSVGTSVPIAAGSTLQLARKVNGALQAGGGCGECKVVSLLGGYNAGVAFSGSMDEVSMWQVSMSADQITELYASGKVLNLVDHSVYVSDNSNLYTWYRMGDNANDAIDGTGTYSLGTNSLVDETGRANGNPGSANYGIVTTIFDTNVVPSICPDDLDNCWNIGASATDTINNLITLVGDSSLNISATKNPSSDQAILTNTKYGASTSTAWKAQGTLGNTDLSKAGSTITVDGMAGGLDPKVMNFNLPRATYYREDTTKRPVNIRNIRMTTGSTIIGNFQENYQVVNSVGAHSNPRSFVENQPTLPSIITTQTNLKSSNVVRNYLTLNSNYTFKASDIDPDHFDFGLDYGITDTSSSINKSIIVSRFGAPGSRETMERGFQDFRSSEFSPYNAIPYRNLSVRNMGINNKAAQTTLGPAGIKTEDINWRPFGLNQLLTRHAARFGRDSLYPFSTYSLLTSFYPYDSDNMNDRGRVYREEALYASTANLQGWWKLNDTGLLDSSGNSRDGSGTVFLAENKTPSTLIQQNSTQFDGSSTAVNVGTAATWEAIIGTGGTSIMTFATWLNFDSLGTYPIIFDFGDSGAGQILLYYNRVAGYWYFRATWDSSDINWYFDPTSAPTLDTWYHFAVTYDATSHTNVPILYINGDAVAWDNSPSPSAPWSGIQTDDCIIGASEAGTYEFDGQIADFGIWDSVLTAAEVKALYYAKDGIYDESRVDDLNPGAIYEQLPSLHKTNRNPLTVMKAQSTTEDGPYITSSVYDNFWVQHAIPRSDQQYLWITASLEDNNEWFRYLPADYVVSRSVGGYVDAYSFLTASQIGTIQSTNYYFGQDLNGPVPYDRYVPGNFVGINFAVYEPVTNAGNFVGYTASTPLYENPSLENIQYLNTKMITGRVGASLGDSEGAAAAAMFNTLILHRQGPYGWPSWKQMRQANHPIIRMENRNNQISVVTGSDTDLALFNLPPVSLRGRPAILNFDQATGGNITLKVTNNNDKIFFNQNEFNDYMGISYNNVVTSFDQLIEITNNSPNYSTNWVLYTENIFPSIRNEGTAYARERQGYDNKYWRDARAARNILGLNTTNSFGIPAAPDGLYGDTMEATALSQSSWPLDAPSDFLTRPNLMAGIPMITETGPPAVTLYAGFRVATGSAGELQNPYFHFLNYGGSWEFPTTYPPDTTRVFKWRSPAALYNRKQTLGSRDSVVSPSGIFIYAVPFNTSAGYPIGRNAWWGGFTEVAGPMHANPFDSVYQIQVGAGEALWEAAAQAGIVIKSNGTSSFKAIPSEPWFNDYDDYKWDLMNIMKDGVIVPEFRISEHVEDYIKYGINSPESFDAFQIVGTDKNSSNSNFYKDYSNSEFLQDFLKIKSDTLLNAREIRLVCSAAIRLNPYKGFYPVQRTIDLVSQFSRSYIDSLSFESTIPYSYLDRIKQPPGVTKILGDLGGAFASVLTPLCSPGILYNSIKSGLAVDYPIITDDKRFDFVLYGTGTLGYLSTNNNWAVTANTSSLILTTDKLSGYSNETGFWNTRLPFETILRPEQYMMGPKIIYLEPHPSASMSLSGTINGAPTDNIYSLMAQNFFGEVPNFFLKNKSFTKIQSDPVADELTFESGSVYGARIKLRRSVNDFRTYQYESSSYGSGSSNLGYTMGGALGYGATPDRGNVSANTFSMTSSYEYELPQDPRQNPNFKETFTMYSRPSAFGPPLSGRPSASYDPLAVDSNGLPTDFDARYRPMDCFNGFNWSFCPPYYHGEAWLDVIFYPEYQKTYNIETILAESYKVYRRFDSGSNCVLVNSGTLNGVPGCAVGLHGGAAEATDLSDAGLSYDAPYGGTNINANAMQISASINLFGVEKVQFKETDQFGLPERARNTSVASRWVLQPKFETPMLNFNDQGVHPITSSDPGLGFGATLSLPVFASSSVPRGMWHQFGVIPDEPGLGIFLDIGDIPYNWLGYHYETQDNAISSYTNKGAATSAALPLSKKMKSLVDLFGFKKDESSARLGELADAQTIREAVVAVPYIIDNNSYTTPTGVNAQGRKKFIEIPSERYDAALANRVGSAEGDSLIAAGESIRKLVQKMGRYILPPQFDFLRNTDIKPMVMYMFEFEYTFDRDDLSYIWQNIAPRDYKKMTMQASSIAHELMNTELLSEANVLDNENLRWMVFKVKQRSQAYYDNLVVAQAGQASNARSAGWMNPTTTEGYQITYNWPYDYVSFVELIKIDAEVLFKSGDVPEYNVLGTTNEDISVPEIQDILTPVIGPPPVTAGTPTAGVVGPPPVATSITTPTAATRVPRIPALNRTGGGGGTGGKGGGGY